MARLTKPLTNTEVNNAKPKAKEYTLSDGKGLYLLVKPNGSKLWRFNYYKPLTTPKKRTLLGVGKYPDISLQQARAIREEYLSLLAQNIDPQQYKIKTEQAEQARLLNTFRAVVEHWKESKAGNIKALTLKKYWAIVERYLLPVLAD
ncbi:integrase arm-type DNA-binding domain-containing protein [Aggregatibacter actinomycetemcomitans]|uniref:integrase arm-type DNA-binding domain-containing protein n=1 Tax=Aggregatibacter actinomycetemcomitans TaxID=714 RepID=UPI001E5D13BD